MANGKVKPKKAVKRLNTALPLPLAKHVGRVTGEGTHYESPDEFIKDLVRRDMERHIERQEIDDLLESTYHDNEITPWTKADLDELRKLAHKQQPIV